MVRAIKTGSEKITFSKKKTTRGLVTVPVKTRRPAEEDLLEKDTLKRPKLTPQQPDVALGQGDNGGDSKRQKGQPGKGGLVSSILCIIHS